MPRNIESQSSPEEKTNIMFTPKEKIESEEQPLETIEQKAKKEAEEIKEKFIMSRVQEHIESNPSILDIEGVKKRWGKTYDTALQAKNVDSQIDELYAEKHENSTTLTQEAILNLEKQLANAKNKAEKEKISTEIKEKKKHLSKMQEEAEFRRNK